MKNLYKIFLGLAFVLATTVGCTEVEVEEQTISTEEVGTFRIAAGVPSSDTRVDVDGLTVTWNESDEIAIAEVGDDGEFVTHYTYTIDAETISEDGKYAEFVGESLTSGKSYIAYNYVYTGYLSTWAQCDVTKNFFCIYGYSYFDHNNVDLMMQSNIFEYDGKGLPQLSFEHKSSLLELEIELESGSEYEGEIESISISSGSTVAFLTDLIFNSYGQSVYAFYISSGEQADASNSIDVKLTESVEFGADSPVSIKVPVTWNGYVTEAEGDFSFTIKTADGKESTVTKPMQILEDGVRYTAELTFEEPTDMTDVDRAALIDFYNSTDGDNWTNNTNWCTDADLNDWYGVDTDNNGRVYQLNLNSNNICGSIPESIGNLSNLTHLYLNGNQLTDSIPETIYELVNLVDLMLHSNQLTGSISELIGNLINLEYFSFGQNQLTGSIPETIGNLSKLKGFKLEANQLDGSIPESIGNLSKLLNLYIDCNQLTGSIPESIGNLTNLAYFHANENKLSGAIPETIGNLTQLQVIQLNINQLSGSIPNSICNLANLNSLLLYDNQLSGSIPESIGNLTNLTHLGLHSNQLTGSIPTSICNLTNLVVLYLLENQLSGPIPEDIGNLVNLKQLDLRINQLSGTIPESLGNIISLEEVYLDNNQLTGTLPESLAKLENVFRFYIYYNNLSGEVSEALANWTGWSFTAWYLGQNEGYGFTSFPDIHLEPSTVTTIENKTINTEDYFSDNELTCVIYWGTWCWYGIYYMETIKDLYNSYASKGFGLISLLDEDLSVITEYVSNNDIPGHVCQVIDPYYFYDGTNRIKYMPTYVSPIYAFVDSSGKIVFSEWIYGFDDPSMSREEATIAFMKEYFGDVDSGEDEDEESDSSGPQLGDLIDGGKL